MLHRNLQSIDSVVVHCSDSMWGDKEVIDAWHKERGWMGVGYHYIILNGYREYEGPYVKRVDGVVEYGRELNMVGAHCKGHNDRSIGICLIGRRHFSLEQFKTLLSLLTEVRKDFPRIDIGRIFAHGELNEAKECPTFDMGFLRSILKHL